MAIGFRASSAAGAASSSGSGTSQAVTIPAAVATGDVLVVCAVVVPISATTPTLSIASTGTTPVAAAAQQTASESLPATLGVRPWTVVCGSGDAGKVITVSSTVAGFFSVAVAAYTGVDNTNPVDVIGGAATAGGNTATVTCPSESTATAGDWALFLGGGAGEGGNLTPPSGSTSRESSVNGGTNVFAVIADGNASAGASGTSIGGGTFTTTSATNSILAAFTIGLKAAGSGTNHPGAATLSGAGSLTAGAVVNQPAAATLTGSGSLTTAASVTGVESAALSGSGSLTSAPSVALKAAAALSGTGTLTAGETGSWLESAALSGSGSLTAAGQALPPISAVFSSTDGNGVQTWTVTSAFNGPTTSVLRILPPTSGSGSFPHSFLFALPVSTGTDATFGDPCTVIGVDLGAHNAYNTTLVVPSFPIQPWYADNPSNTQQSQESFMLALAAWMAASSFASGGEKNYLIGFSKSGIGGQGLQFHRPDVWAATASWDAPFCMTDYDGTDPTNGGTVGGNSSTCYGSSANFTTNYELTPTHLTTWAASGNLTTRRRLWIGGYFAFQADVSAYMTRLASAGIAFDGSHVSLDSSHAWHDDWVADALASIMVDPEFVSAATLSGTGALTAGALVTQPAAATLSGLGSLTAGRIVTQPAGAALSGIGSLTAAVSVQLTSAAALSGAGALTSAALATQPAGAALTGTGSLTASALVQFTSAAALAGTGALTVAALVSQPAGVSLSGLGTLTAAGSVSGFTLGSASLAGTGVLTTAASVQFTSAAALAGTGALTAAGSVAQPASAALSGAGVLAATGAVSGFTTASAALSGTGVIGVAVSVAFRPAAALSGTGTLTVATLVAVPAAASLSGTGSLAAAVLVVVPASAVLSGLGTLTASPAVSGASAAASLSGSGSLTAGPVLTLTATAVLSGIGVLSVSVQVTSPVTEAPVAWSAQPAPPRWTAAPAQPRWRVVMALFGPIAAVSLEEVNVTWMSSLAGTSVDPTGETDGQPALPVQMAFPPTSGNYAEPAQPQTWFAGSWLLGGTSIGFVAQALVGPGGGVVTLTSGQVFDVWSKVVGVPESPARFVGQLPVY
jgi:hypothetical protein